MIVWLVIFFVSGILGVGYMAYDGIINFPELFMEVPWYIKILTVGVGISSFLSAAFPEDYR